jgi:two-component system chemotaxis sensor kinase CheA
MSDELPQGLRPELLDDFYAEFDELLVALRDGLAKMEQAGLGSAATPERVEGLLRTVHSIKGISAIVGLRPVELLAHAMEGELRTFSKKSARMTSDKFDAFAAATQRLDQMVADHRAGRSIDDGSDVLKQLTAKAGSHAGTGAGRPASAAASDAEMTGLPYRATFSPTSALNQRGINVNGIRSRLLALGDINHATPSVHGPGMISFEFDLNLRHPPEDTAGWEADGVVFTALHSDAKPTVDAALTPAQTVSLSSAQTVRVDLARLDELMRLTGELVIHRLRLDERLAREAPGSEALQEVNLSLARTLRDMRDGIVRARMVPGAEIFERIPFVVRDLVRGSEKKARVVLEGQSTEIDKFVVERLKEPLLHLVRNAFAHGIEDPGERIAAGKPSEGTIRLQASRDGTHVAIELSDDGRGVDFEAVAKRARRLGLVVPDALTSDAVLKILCTPGFSTRDEADRAAGRGVGMSVVQNVVHELGGTLSLATQPGKGTSFTLRLPLSLSIMAAIIVGVGNEWCAVPQSAVDEVMRVSTKEIRLIKRTEVIPYRGGLLPLVRLTTTYRLPASTGESAVVLVLETNEGATGLVVDRVRTQLEIVVRPLTDPLLRAKGVSGTTELGDGRPILILNPSALAEGVVRPTVPGQPVENSAA